MNLPSFGHAYDDGDDHHVVEQVAFHGIIKERRYQQSQYQSTIKVEFIQSNMFPYLAIAWLLRGPSCIELDCGS